MMKFREMLTMLEALKVKNTHPHGTYVAAQMGKSSIKQLDKWCTDNNIVNPCDPNQYHTTIIYSKKGVPDVKHFDFKLPITANVSEFKIFDADHGRCLVAVVDSAQLDDYHKRICTEYGATHGYPDYHAHVTLSYDYTPKEVPTVLPTMALVFDHIKIEKLDGEKFIPTKKED